MVSEMAIDDIESLQDDGYEVTPRDIVKLNALGLKVQKNSISATMSIMPRCAILGNVVLHEPTIGSEIWRASASKLFDMENYHTFISMMAYSLGTKESELVDPYEGESLQQAVQSFMKDSVGQFTEKQIYNALDYVINGNDPREGEDPPSKNIQKEEVEDEVLNEDCCYQLGLLRNGVALEIESIENMKRMTTSELEVMMEYKMAMKYGEKATKSNSTKYLAEYYSVIDEIKGRGKKK